MAMGKYLLIFPAAFFLFLFNAEKIDAVNPTNIGEKSNVNITEQSETSAPLDSISSKRVSEVFAVVEEMPSFPGDPQGKQDQLMRFLGENVKYPILAQEAGAHGRVTVRFVVSKDGSIRDIKVLSNTAELINKLSEVVVVGYGAQKGDNSEEEKKKTISLEDAKKELEKEVIRMVESMPKWTPGKMKGKEVDVYYTLPILFRLK